jgi:hypothetical protein
LGKSRRDRALGCAKDLGDFALGQITVVAKKHDQSATSREVHECGAHCRIATFGQFDARHTG